MATIAFREAAASAGEIDDRRLATSGAIFREREISMSCCQWSAENPVTLSSITASGALLAISRIALSNISASCIRDNL